jgi:YHS domain-containing protein
MHPFHALEYNLRRKSYMVHPRKAFLISVLFLCLSLFILPGASGAKDQTTCPVMGGLVNKNIYVDHEGNRVYFCCPPCVKQFKKDPDPYIKKMKEQGFTLAKSPNA